MEKFIDLHMHTNFSDGLFSPSEILDKVREADLSAFAITDHDTLRGALAVKELLRDNDPELIFGIELSADYGEADLHILAYGFDPNYIPLTDALLRFQNIRSQRGKRMVEKLNEMGVNVSYQDVERKAGSGVIGRPHVAEAIFESGAVNRYNEAFEKYIGLGKPAYVPKANFEPQEAIDLIHNSGGVAVLAHPGVGDAAEHIPMLAEMGLDGIEAYHPEHTFQDKENYIQIAKELGLTLSGGSDYHGRTGRDQKIGSQKVPFKYLKKLLEKAKSYQ